MLIQKGKMDPIVKTKKLLSKLSMSVLVVVFVVLYTLIIPTLGMCKTKIVVDTFGAPPVEPIKHTVEKFEQKYPDIEVELWICPPSMDEHWSKLATLFTAGEKTPDVVNIDVIWPAAMASAGWLEPLDSRFTPEEREDFIDAMIKAVSYNDQVWAVPWYMDGGLLLWRTDLLEEVGYDSSIPPETWMDMVEQGQKVMEMNNGEIWGFVASMARDEQIVCNFVEFLYSNNGEIIDDKGNVVVNNPEGVGAAQFMYDLIYKYGIMPPASTGYVLEEARQVFQAGKSLFHRNWGYAYGLAQAEDSPIRGKVKAGPLPKFPDGKHATCTGGWNLAINKNSEHKEEAWTFIDYFTSYEAMKERILMGGRTPARKALFIDKDVATEYPHYPSYLEAYENGVVRPVHPMYLAMAEVMRTELHRVVTGEEEARVALDSMAKGLEKILATFETK